MMIQQFERILKENQFRHLKTNVPHRSIHCKIEEGKVYILSLYDFSYEKKLINPFSDFSLYHMERQIEDCFYKENFYNIEFMSIFFTKDLELAKEIAQETKSYWIVDLDYNRLIIYENQPSDYMFLREALEGLLELKILKRSKIEHFSPINTFLVIINILVFIVLEMGGDTQDAYYMLTRGAMFGPVMVENGEYYRLFTSMFLHFGVNHLAGNMLSLIFLGDNLERVLGKVKYLILYLLSGLGASFCSFLYNMLRGEIVVAAGASGAIFGVIGALFYILIKNKGKLEDLTSLRLGILIVYILYSGFMTPGIDNTAHIGGLLIGFLLAIFMYPKIDKKQKRKEMGRLE